MLIKACMTQTHVLKEARPTKMIIDTTPCYASWPKESPARIALQATVGLFATNVTPFAIGHYDISASHKV